MIRCIAIDDEPLALRQITSYISKIPTLELVNTFRSAVVANEWLQSNNVDLMFVDIDMPDMSGVEFVSSLDKQAMVIFTTAYAEYAIEGYKLEAIDYLLKPFGLKDLSRAADKAVSLHELWQLRDKQQVEESAGESNDDGAEAADDKAFISIHADRRTTLVKVANIVFLESAGEYVRLHLADGSKLVTLFRLKNMESSLPSSMFMRVHRSYIINLNYISGFTKGRVFLEGDDYVPIGENYKESFLAYVNDSM